MCRTFGVPLRDVDVLDLLRYVKEICIKEERERIALVKTMKERVLIFRYVDSET